jgi:hypothetical protein
MASATRLTRHSAKREHQILLSTDQPTEEPMAKPVDTLNWVLTTQSLLAALKLKYGTNTGLGCHTVLSIHTCGICIS